MDKERLENLERSVADLTSFVRFALAVVLLVEFLALAAIFATVYKIGEFWMVDSRNMYRRIETLERHHAKE